MGTHPIFESDFDCLTDYRTNYRTKNKNYRKMAPISLATLVRTVSGKLFNIPLAHLRRGLVDQNLFNFHEKCIQYQFWYTSTVTSRKLKISRYIDGSNFPSNENIEKLATKNGNKVIQNKKEIIEYYADWTIQIISFIFTIVILYIVYIMFEQESKEKEAKEKNLIKEKMN